MPSSDNRKRATDNFRLMLSATIITLNEERNIARCLNSLQWCDEVIVCDSFSTDKTREIATSFPNVRFLEETWRGYGAQKNFTASKASNEWIFNIDSDEVCSPELAASIQNAVRSNDGFNAYQVIRRNHFCGKLINHCGLGRERITRLYRRDKTSFSETKVHEGIPEANVGILQGDLLHHSFASREDFIERHRKYARLSALDMKEKGRRCHQTDLLFRPLITFFKIYILKLGVLDGKIGYFLAKEYARYCYLKYAELKKLGERESQ